MKKKIFSLLFAILLIVAVIFSLTACDDEESSSKKKSSADTSSAESVIEAFADAVNNQDASAMCDLIDFDALGKTYGNDINKKDLKTELKKFFEEYDDLEVKVSKIKHLKKDSDMLDSLLEAYDSYEDYIEEIEDNYDIKNSTIYTAKVELSEDYEDMTDDLDFERDVIYMTENDDEFKIVYSRLILGFYSDYVYGDYDDEYDYNYDNEPTEEAKKFNKDFEEYDGVQTGKVVNELLDKIMSNNLKNIDDHPIYVSYYAKGGSLEELMVTTKSDISNLKTKIDESHKYDVVFESDYQGFVRYIDVKY